MNHSIYSDIISAKYDSSLDHPITMYDQLPYQRDSDYCNAEKLALQSGRIIKYYLCMNQTEKCMINNHDDKIESILAAIQTQELQKDTITAPKPEIPETQDGITPEQIQTLLEDPDGKKEDSDDSAEDFSNFTNSFEGVEDW